MHFQGQPGTQPEGQTKGHWLVCVRMGVKRSGCHRQRRKQALGWRRFRTLAGQTVVPEAEGGIAEILLSAEGRSGQAAGLELVNQGVPLRCRAMDAGCGFHDGCSGPG